VCTSIPAQNEAAGKGQNEKPAKAEFNFSILIRFHWGSKCSLLLVSSPEALRCGIIRHVRGECRPIQQVTTSYQLAPSAHLFIRLMSLVIHLFGAYRSDWAAIQSNEWTEMQQQQQDDAKRNQFGCALNQVDWPMRRTALSLQLPCGDQSNLCRPGQKGKLQLDNSSAHLFFGRPGHCLPENLTNLCNGPHAGCVHIADR
jgi:hypothetical protein